MKRIKYIILSLFCFLIVSTISYASSTSVDTTRAIVYGISKYKNDGIKDLNYADRDAVEFVKFLKSDSGGNLTDDQIILRTNEEAFKLQLSFDLEWLDTMSMPGDEAIFYFSGHGDTDEKVENIPPGYLLCHNALPGHYSAMGGYALNDLEDRLNRIAKKAKIKMIIDACRAGIAKKGQYNGSQAASAIMKDRFPDIIKLLSCKSNQLSQEGKSWGGGRGAFSYYLVNGLYGMADKDEDYVVSLGELRNYVENNLQNINQQPQVDGDNDSYMSDVNVDFLDSLKSNLHDRFLVFSPIGVKGSFERKLEKLDSTTTLPIYEKFIAALEKQRFYSPESDCADKYYHELIEIPEVIQIKNVLRDKFAFALLERSQNFLYDVLEAQLSSEKLSYNDRPENFETYARLVDMAIKLLGIDHEMYETLVARKYYFLAKSKEDKAEKKLDLEKALQYKKDMAHVYLELITTCDTTDIEDAETYSKNALGRIPSWDMPYLFLYKYYTPFNTKKAESNLNVIKNRGSNSQLFWWEQAHYLRRQKKFESALKYFRLVEELKKSRSADGGQDVQILALSNEIGNMEYHLVNYKEAIEIFYLNSKKYPESAITWKYLSRSYFKNATINNKEHYQKAIAAAKKAIEIHNHDQAAHELLAEIYREQGNTELETKYVNRASSDKTWYCDDWRIDY